MNPDDTELKSFIENEKAKKVLYLGSDRSFFENLKQKFLEQVHKEVLFHSVESESDEEIQSHINLIRDARPQLVLVDYSKNEKAMLHLTRICMRQNKLYPVKFIGLADYKQGGSVILTAIMAQLTCVHIKSSELDSLIFNMFILGFDLNKGHAFAMAELNDPISVFYACKAGKISIDEIHIESNIPIQANQELEIRNYWSKNQIISSNRVQCLESSQENLYYNFNYSQRLKIHHGKEFIRDPDWSEEEFNQKFSEYEELVENSKYRLKKWINENINDSKPKFLKAYIVDKEGVFFDNKPLTDTYDFVFRVQPYIKDVQDEIKKTRPQLIIFNLEDVDPKVLEANPDLSYMFNNSRMLQHLIRNLREMFQPDDQPIVVVFNAKEHDSVHYQRILKYTNILAVKEEMRSELVLKMANMLKEKIKPKLPTPGKFEMFIDKNTELSYVEVESQVELIACSENDLYFNSDSNIAIGSVMRVSLPVPMYITVVPYPEKTRVDAGYYAIIHGIGEEERKELRRYINDIFFRDLEFDKAKDAEEIEAMKQKYLEERQKQEEKLQKQEVE
jgi:hypothetical protein